MTGISFTTVRISFPGMPMQSIKTGMQATSWGASVRFWLGSVLNESLNSMVSHPVTPPSLLLLFHSAQVTVIPCVNCGASKQKRSFAASPWEDHRDPQGSMGILGDTVVAYLVRPQQLYHAMREQTQLATHRILYCGSCKAGLSTSSPSATSSTRSSPQLSI